MRDKTDNLKDSLGCAWLMIFFLCVVIICMVVWQ